MELTSAILEEIKAQALHYFKERAVGRMEADHFLAKCYAQATLDILLKYKTLAGVTIKE